MGFVQLHLETILYRSALSNVTKHVDSFKFKGYKKGIVRF